MKRFLLFLVALASFAGTTTAVAQRIALIDMEYILKHLPAYERANEQLNQSSKLWQSEVEALSAKAKTLYTNYQNEMAFLSQSQKKEREQAILDTEKQASELKMKYFGPQGELYKKRESLIRPIQDDVYNAVKAVADTQRIQLVLDRASETAGIIFASPAMDISADVLNKLGYRN
ncbi:MAG: OmpH family outer membrane protein [Bacteroidales bacterium]|nr:OmpH family outer membrane protein [Bacteroidales bacterium]